jgi:hypothetical protein
VSLGFERVVKPKRISGCDVQRRGRIPEPKGRIAARHGDNLGRPCLPLFGQNKRNAHFCSISGQIKNAAVHNARNSAKTSHGWATGKQVFPGRPAITPQIAMKPATLCFGFDPGFVRSAYVRLCVDSERSVSSGLFEKITDGEKGETRAQNGDFASDGAAIFRR